TYQFNPGAVGFHVASFTMQTLHKPTPQWVAALLRDGVVATIGAVNEPLLGAFPTPDDFFPLLFTGELPLAEVYWKTVPSGSWMLCLIGDPLYTPFKQNPQVAVRDLPVSLQRAFRGMRLAPTEEGSFPGSPAPAPTTQGVGANGR